jgi:hypothetical protein
VCRVFDLRSPRQAHYGVKSACTKKAATRTPPMGWWLGLAPATLEFWVRFPNERNQGKQAHPVLKYRARVPHGSQLVVSRSTCPPLSPSPHANSFVIGTAVINTHTRSPSPRIPRCPGGLYRPGLSQARIVSRIGVLPGPPSTTAGTPVAECPGEEEPSVKKIRFVLLSNPELNPKP